jgi:V8-like Glu-specific endopeptidase
MSEKPSNHTEELHSHDQSSLFPPQLDEIEGLPELMQERPSEELIYEKVRETICGTTDDSQAVEQYDGTLGVMTAFVNAHQAAVGQLQWNDNLASIYTNPGSFSGARWCTGTMISDDLFLTAGHCLDSRAGVPLQNGTTNPIQPAEIATNMHVNFNYQVDPAGNPRVEQSFPITALVEHRLGGLDFAIVRLGDNPGRIFGTTQISQVDAVLNSMACIIGHPAGLRKRIEAGPVTLLQGDSIGYNDIDTLGGNSGSGILNDADGRIVGVHTNGGCDATMTGHNFGVRITSIIAQSPTLQLLTNRGLLFYNAATGEGATSRIDAAGNYTFVGSISGFSTDWTHIVGASNGGVLFYSASTGLGATATIDTAGNYTFVSTIPGFGLWTHIVAANGGSLLFYNAATGEGATSRIDAAGNYTFVGSISGFSTDWTHIVGASNGGVLFYSASTGLGATATIDTAGNYTFVSTIPGFGLWTHIVGL